MDAWIVAAAAGAGFVAQHLKNLRTHNHNSLDLSSDNKLRFIRPDPPRNLQFEEEVCEQREHAYHDASTSGFKGEKLIQLDNNFAFLGMVSDSNSLAGLFKIEDVEDITNGSVSQPSIRFSNGYRRNRSRIGSRQINSRFIKPRTSLESCLMAQLYKEQSEIEEYTHSIHPSQKPTFRPFLGSSKPNRKRDFLQSKDTHSQENKTVLCVPRLPRVVTVDLEMNAKAKTGKGQVFVGVNTGKVIEGKQSNAQGSLNDVLPFFIGLTMGISYSLSGHEREIDKLRKSLKQSENLVQDLQEELEMKDALTVKELTIEDYESSVHKDSYFDDGMQILSLEQKLNSSSMYCNDENNYQSIKDESLRKIEAELEAELDRLESNINSSGLEGKISDVAELDPDSVAYAIEGELRADLFAVETDETYAGKEENSSSISTSHSTHYPVSPRELSLRLHEVIQSRLEERVKELETALEYNESKIKSMGHKTGRESQDAQPVVINLSGEALSAHNEAFTKVSESDEEESYNSNGETFHPQRHDLENGWLSGSCRKLSNGRLETSFCGDDGDITVLNDVMCSSREGSENGEENEMERILIRQIVEKARRGSPAVLKAQRAFLSTHET